MRRIALVAGVLAAITGSAAAFAAPDPKPAPAPDPLAGAWVLMLDGAVAGHVGAVDRCGIAAEVAETRDAKHVAGYAPDICDIHVSIAMSREFSAWLTGALAGESRARTLQLVRFDAKTAYTERVSVTSLR